jgi:hypothetical protein
MIKQIGILGITLFTLTGCFSQHLYYDESKFSMVEENLNTLFPYYLLLPVKSSDKVYEICIDWETFYHSYLRNNGFVDTTKKNLVMDSLYLFGGREAQEIVKGIYSGKQKYFEVDNIETSVYKDFIVNQEYYDKYFKGIDIETVLIKYTQHNILVDGYEHRIQVDYDVYRPNEKWLEQQALIKYLILNEFWVSIGGYGGVFSAADCSKEGNKIPWEDIKASWE